MTDIFPLPDPRLQGVKEHYERALLFKEMAKNSDDDITRYRLLLASLYSARAIVEIMLVTAEKQQIKNIQSKDEKENHNKYKQTLIPILPHYLLIEKIRIHDFHRFGIIPPDPNLIQMFGGGPIKLKASSGSAMLMVGATGKKVVETGNSKVIEQRSLNINDGKFLDDESGKYLSLEDILTDYFRAVPKVIEEFEQSLC